MLSQQHLAELLRFDSGASPVVSTYLTALHSTTEADAPTRLKALVKRVREAADDESLDRDARMALRDDAAALERLEQTIVKPAAPAIAAFSCAGKGFFQVIELPRRVADRVVIDADPYVRPLLAILDEFHRYCSVVIDRRHGRIFEFYMNELRECVESIDEGVRKKSVGGRFGYDEHNTRNHAREVVHRHFREVARIVFEQFRANSFEVLFVGGPKDAVDEFIPHLHPWVRERLHGTFTIDLNGLNPARVREECEALADAYERAEERKLVEEITNAAASPGGRGALGLERVLDAANMAAVDTLAIHGDATHPGLRCGSCGWLGLDANACPMCDATLERLGDVIDALVDDVVAEGGRVEHVYATTPLEAHTVGALLRFPLPTAGD